MSSVRVAVEWPSAQLRASGASWTPKVSKIGLSPIGKLYIIAGFFTYCQFCARGRSQTRFFFGLDLPTLETYLDDHHRCTPLTSPTSARAPGATAGSVAELRHSESACGAYSASAQAARFCFARTFVP
ncbi:hypothetical protein PybrP1_008774 [[Pythium] brassicae (nom. inval.)]|nr:hypothetical protein PybrP1_008774 [[Pythium] brassicae (nom. inval.)]